MRIVGNPPSGGKKPTTPTIGTATDGGTGTSVSVAFTPSTYIGKSTITYTATSSPGSLTGTGSGSPITVSGLTTGTAYTFTVKGDTNYGVASDYSAASNSVTPASPSSFESIATATPTGTTVTFSSIPSTYKALQIRYNVIASAGGSNSNITMTFNSDSGSNYANHILWVQYAGGTVTASAETSATNAYANSGYGAVMNTTSPMVGIVDIIDYASTSKYKTVRVFDGVNRNGTNYSGIDLSSSLWMSTSAINRIDLTSGGFASGTTIALYGIKG